MGVLTGFSGPLDAPAILSRRITLQGIYVGPVAMLQALVRTGIQPVVDQVFAFGRAEAAYEALAAAGHLGELLIRTG